MWLGRRICRLNRKSSKQLSFASRFRLASRKWTLFLIYCWPAFQPCRRGSIIKGITLFYNDACITKKIQRFLSYSAFRKKNKKTGALDQAVQKIDFCEVHFGISGGEGSGTLKLCQSIYLKPRPVPFHQHSLLYTFKVTHVSVKLNRMQCKQSDFKTQIVCNANKVILFDEKINVDFKSFVVWVKWMSN